MTKQLDLTNRKGCVSIYDIKNHKFVTLRGENLKNAVAELPHGEIREVLERHVEDMKSVGLYRKEVIDLVKRLAN